MKRVSKMLMLFAVLGCSTLSAMPAWARSLVLAGGGFKDVTPTVYASDGVTPRAPGTGSISSSPAGAEYTAAIFQKIVALATGGKKIGVFTTASDNASASVNGQYYVDVFKYFGAGSGTVWIPVKINAAGTACDSFDSTAIVNQINSMDGFFFGGGDQSRILQCFYNISSGSRTDKPIMTALRNKYNAGAVVSGTSAGTAIMAGGSSLQQSGATAATVPMVTGGESYYALLNGVYNAVNGDNLAQDPLGGFGFFTHGVLDTHFSERGRQGRIVRLAWQNYVRMAYGADENSALVVINAESTTPTMEAIGERGAFIFDTLQSSRTKLRPGGAAACNSSTSTNFALCMVRTHYLSRGDKFVPPTSSSNFGTFTFAAGKATPASGSLLALPSPEDIFSSPDNRTSDGSARLNPRNFANRAIRLLATSSSTTRDNELTFEGTSSSKFKICMIKSAKTSSSTTLTATIVSESGTETVFGATVPRNSGFRNLIVDFMPSSSTCPSTTTY